MNCFHPPTHRLLDRRFARPHVEPLSDARTKPGERRVSARQGRAGEKRAFFNILSWRLFLLETATGAGLSGDLDLIDAVREKIFFEFRVEHFEFQKVGAKLLGD